MTQVAFLYPVVMKKKRLPFTIGGQYELHEFQLDEVETVLIGEYEYDVYRCGKKLFDGLELDGLMDVKLYYNADILARVDCFFEKSHDESVMNLFTPSEKEDVIIIRFHKDFIVVTVTQSKYNLFG